MTLPAPCEDHPDVIISGHPDDMTLIRFLAEGVAKEGLSVWYPVENQRIHAPHLIPQTKAYIIVLSPEALSLEELKDDIALAYMANTAIFPASTKSYRKLNTHIDGGLRLMLSRIQWTFFLKPEHLEQNLPNLLSSITRFVSKKQTKSEHDKPFNMLSGHLKVITGESSNTVSEDEQQPNDFCDLDTEYVGDFWQRHFDNMQEVSYTAFCDKFNADYSDRIGTNFGSDKQKLFESLMFKDIFCLRQVLSKDDYQNFIADDAVSNATPDPDAFYDRLASYVSSRLAVRKVLDMDSTVRLTAIQQLGSFKTPPVVRQLKDLTSDADPNIRAVAALALAKTGMTDPDIEDLLIGLLSNKDRLVRESACLSLAHMKSLRSMNRVLHLWRNDPIKHVREAAELALSRMGLDAAKEAMKVTTVLTQELTALKEASKKSTKS